MAARSIPGCLRPRGDRRLPLDSLDPSYPSCLTIKTGAPKASLDELPAKIKGDLGKFKPILGPIIDLEVARGRRASRPARALVGPACEILLLNCHAREISHWH